jgi:hypothetical protein
MKKSVFLIPAIIGAALLGGCAGPAVVVAPAPAPYYYGDPYYVYGGVNYYYAGGRYFYYRNHQRFFVGGLPHGGYYWRGHPYRRYYHGRWR